MRFNINLASRPYENAQWFYMQWAVGLAIALVLTGVLVFAAARSWSANHALARSISAERNQLQKLNDQEKSDLAILNQPQNQGVRQQSQALNALIVRKSVSWTRIFNDLEKIMPARLHVVSITPQLSKSNQLLIRMVVAGDSRDKAIELVENMEKAADFREPQILSEKMGTNAEVASGDKVTFNIIAQYAPTMAPNEAATATGAQTPAMKHEASITAPSAGNGRPKQGGAR